MTAPHHNPTIWHSVIGLQQSTIYTSLIFFQCQDFPTPHCLFIFTHLILSIPFISFHKTPYKLSSLSFPPTSLGRLFCVSFHPHPERNSIPNMTTPLYLHFPPPTLPDTPPFSPNHSGASIDRMYTVYFIHSSFVWLPSPLISSPITAFLFS